MWAKLLNKASIYNMLKWVIPKRIKNRKVHGVYLFFSSGFSFSYLNELPLFQFAVISLVRNEVICFSTFFHTFKNFYSPSCWTFVASASASAKSWYLSSSFGCTNLAFFFSVEILSNWQSIFSSFSTFRDWNPRSKHGRSSATMAERRKHKFLCLAESVT